MSDTRKKLDALSKELGLKKGSELPEKKADAPRPEPEDRGAAAAGPSPARKPGGNRELLENLRDRLNLMSGGEWQERRREEEKRRASGDYEVERVLGGEIIGDDEAGFFLLRSEYPLEYRQGEIELGAAIESDAKHIAFSAADPELAGFDPYTTFFVDTETTGLMGGAGTTAFLIGAGYFTEDSFRLDQCFMRDYDDEEPMLAYLAERFAGCETVAGYNSKSFDLPLLRTRFIQNRLPNRLEGVRHLDLVHVARRFWKRRLPDCTLGTVEREILGIERHGDVPGHLIPQIWLDYLHTRDARPLEGVFYHHRMDILSLVSLTGWISRRLGMPEGSGFDHSEDRLSVVRLHFRQKQYEETLEHGLCFLEKEERGELRRECLEMLAMAAKRLRRHAEMQEHFELLLSEFPSNLMARLELAKHHEHHTGNLAEAEKLCHDAIALLECSCTDDVLARRETAAFEARLKRIHKKMRRTGYGDDGDPDYDIC
jgi:uncharacterized protein